MSSYYSKRVKSRQIQDEKATRATRAYQKCNNRKNYRKPFSDTFCSAELYRAPANNFGTSHSQKTATFLRKCKRGRKTAIDLISTGKISKATIVRGFEIALTFGHTGLVGRFIQLGVTDYFSFQPVEIPHSLGFSRIISIATKENNLRFCEWFTSQAISQGNFTREFLNELRAQTLRRKGNPSILRMLLKCHPDPAFIIDSQNLVRRSFGHGRYDLVEVLLEFKPAVNEWLVDKAIKSGWISGLEMSLKTGRVEPKHSHYPLPRLLNLDMDRDVILSPKELNVVRTLLKYGANLDERDEGMNLLHSAAIQLRFDDRYGREVMDFMFEYIFEFDYTEKYEMKMVVDFLPMKYREEYQTKMVERIEVVRDIVFEVGQIPLDCTNVVAVCLYGEALRMLSLL